MGPATAIVLTVAWLMVYGATIFGGFVRDDFGWVYHSRLDSWGSIPAIFGVNPLPYARTNLLLGLGCAVAAFALHDDLSTRANFRHVFAGLLVEASALYFGNEVSMWIEPPPPEVDPATRPAINGRTFTFRLIDGRVEPVRIIDAGN